MKALVSQIVAAYKVLGEAKTASLDVSDILEIIRVRRAMRPFVEDYEAFAKDAGDKLRPVNYDVLIAIEQKGDEATAEEKALYQHGALAYRKAVAEAISAEFSKEVDVDIPVLSDSAIASLIKENGWNIGVDDELFTFSSK